MTTSGFRELTMTADALFRFLRAATQAQPVRIDHERIPKTAALSGVEFDVTPEAGTSRVTLKLFDQWRDSPDPTGPVELIYTQRAGNTGTASDWGTPVLLTDPRRTA